MNRAAGYVRAAWSYVHTPKGRHDALDYAGAALRIGLTAALLWGLHRLWESGI